MKVEYFRKRPPGTLGKLGKLEKLGQLGKYSISGRGLQEN